MYWIWSGLRLLPGQVIYHICICEDAVKKPERRRDKTCLHIFIQPAEFASKILMLTMRTLTAARTEMMTNRFIFTSAFASAYWGFFLSEMGHKKNTERELYNGS